MPELVEPAYRCTPEYTQTLGPEVADLATEAGFEPDPEQRLALDLIFALDKQGKSAAFEFGLVASRQNLKTGVFKQASLGWLYVTRQPLIVWSAHEFGTTKEALRDLAALIESSRYLSRRLKTIRFANDDPSIELMSGQRIKFKARTKSGGRGLTGHKVVLDEAFALTDDHMGALLPTVSVVPDPQILYGSSAGLAHSAVLRRIRDRGRAGTSARLAYLEWCAETDESCADENCAHQVGSDGCLLDRVDLWQRANTLLGRVRANGTGLTVDYVKAERQAMPPSEFARERLGWWDEPVEHEERKIPIGLWNDRADAGSSIDAGLVLAFDMTPNRDWTSIAAAGLNGDGLRHVEITGVDGNLDHRPGGRWVVERILDLVERHHPVAVMVDGKSPAASLIPELEDAGLQIVTDQPDDEHRLVVVNASDMAQACGMFYDDVIEGTLRHIGQTVLDDAVEGADTRVLSGAWAWSRASEVPISPLVASTLALLGHLRFANSADLEPFFLVSS